MSSAKFLHVCGTREREVEYSRGGVAHNETMQTYLGGVIPVELELDVAQVRFEYYRVHVGRFGSESEGRSYKRRVQNRYSAPDSL